MGTDVMPELPERLGHDHDADDCLPCQRCGHSSCEHVSYTFGLSRDEDCDHPGCECPAWLADGDCPGGDDAGRYCNGGGGWWAQPPGDRGDTWIACPTCRGTGVYYDHTRPVAS